MKDVIVAVGIVAFMALWVFGVGYLRYRYRDHYESSETPWFLAILLWPFSWVFVAFMFAATWCFRLGCMIATRQDKKPIPRAEVRR